ncbi:LOW QUALITY PROTEIN: hypothetical protein ACHAW5_006776 [Stephanodiscus triporus]|uniref:SNF2 N-terminal domain-containing protein n=1 Tax=Stephanodiscus triporus TaxID=2934178 RepID=A0ABD3NNJ3_9STRA
MTGRNKRRWAIVILAVPGLVPVLHPYKVAAVCWMLEREHMVDAGDEWELCWFILIEHPPVKTSTGDEGGGGRDAVVRSNVMLLPKWKNIKSSPDERWVFCNPFSGWMAGSYGEAKCMMLGNEGNGSVMGGILAESMGLGKTVKVITCILANPSPQSLHTTPSQHILVQVESASGADAVGKSLHPISNTAVSSHREMINSNNLLAKPCVDTICICGQSTTFAGCLSWVVCERCHGGMHGRCAGFESEEELASKTKYNSAAGVMMCPSDHCATCVAAAISQNDGTSIIYSRATLIVTPHAILVQWQSEISRHTKEPLSGRLLKVVIYLGVRDLCPNADVVLMTFQTLMSELVHSNENPFAGFTKGQSCLRSKNTLHCIAVAAY